MSDQARTGRVLSIFRYLVLGAGLNLILGSMAMAQTGNLRVPDANLANLTSVRVTASQTTPDAVNCGPDLDDLLPHMEEELKAGGLQVVETPAHLLTVSILTVHDAARGVCSSATMLGSYKLVSFFDETQGALKSGYVVLWQRGKQVMSPPTDHAVAVEGAVNRLIGGFLEDWRRDEGSRESSSNEAAAPQ